MGLITENHRDRTAGNGCVIHLVDFSSIVIGGRAHLDGKLPRCRSVQHARIWIKTNSREIQAIRIPVTRYSGMVAACHIGMILTGVNKQLKLFVGHIKKSVTS
jgi:hypothetical protein